MNLENFKSHYICRPDQIIVIDRSFVLDGNEMHLIALTYKDDSYTLWVMDCLSEEMDEYEMTFDPSKRTNRQSLEKRIIPNIRSIESLEVGKHFFEFNGSSTDSFHFQGNASMHRLQYFIDHGIELI